MLCLVVVKDLDIDSQICPYIPFGKKRKDSSYKLSDEFSLFYLKFMELNRTPAKGAWQKLSATPVYASWSGLAFENLCIKHIAAIEKKLGIAAIYTESSSWRSPGNHAVGAKIDLLIDRRDQCINLCEMKIYSSEVAIDKTLAAELRQKETIFREQTKTKK